MPTVDFDQADEYQTPDVRPGTYLCQIVRCDEKYNTEKARWEWQLELEHLEKPYFHVFDWFHFTPAAIGRVKVLYKALDLPHKGQIECKPQDVLKREVLVNLVEDNYKGQKKMRPDGFRGYESVHGDGKAQLGASEPVKDPDVPF